MNCNNPERENVQLQGSRTVSGNWIFMGLILLLFSTSCNKFLDIQPEGEFTSNQLLKDATGFESAMYGVYATMANEPLYGRNLSHNMLDVLAQYFVCQSNDFAESLLKYDYKQVDVESELSSTWSKSYNNISNVNNILKNLERFNPANLEYYNLYKGEALGLRAFMHFDLLRMYTENVQLNSSASGIPYAMDFGLKAPDFIPLADVYTKIIADLTEAEQLLRSDEQNITFPKRNSSYNFLKDREIHFNLYAVQATLARVYLTKGDLPNALLYAEKVIKANKYQLLTATEISNGEMKGVLYPKEAIFGLYTNTLFARVNGRFYLATNMFSYNPRSDIKTYYDNVQGGHDYRLDGFFTTPSRTLRFTKLVDPYQLSQQEYLRPTDRVKGINLIRLPEMYYIAAEALLATNPDQAREYFDTVIKSRGLVGLKDRMPETPLTLDMINEERFKELIGEGQTFFNMKRLNKDIKNTLGQIIPASKAVYVLPIPILEFEYRN